MRIPPISKCSGNMSAHNWLILIASVDAFLAAGILILVMVLRRWSGGYFALGLGAGVLLIVSLVVLGRALGLL
jgi:hypothetical protein